MKLIDKDKIVAEIEKRRKEAELNCGGYKSYDEHRCNACTVDFYEEFLEILDTTETKEVNIEKEVIDWWNEYYGSIKKNYTFEGYTGHYFENSTLIEFAKHFYKLGLNTK